MKTQKSSLLPLLLALKLFFLPFMDKIDFKTWQLQQARVQKAYAEKGDLVLRLLEEKCVGFPHIFLQVFKQERLLEVWVKNKHDQQYKRLTDYYFCESSGNLGPKRQYGDHQIPEGFYFIDRFNPWSNFHLSLGINYPNASDRILSPYKNRGGDIFIHGGCGTVGCIPITDAYIQELYVLAVEARANGQEQIPVYIFPCRLQEAHISMLKKEYTQDEKLIDFWMNLKEGYNYFEKTRMLPNIHVSEGGRYIFDTN